MESVGQMQAFLGNGLKDVPRPPSAWPNTCSSYTCFSITQISNLNNYELTIPMKDYGRITTAAEQQTDTLQLRSCVRQCPLRLVCCWRIVSQRLTRR